MKRLFVFAGPNGSGKSSVIKIQTESFQTHLSPFLNADLLEAKLRNQRFLNFIDYQLLVDPEAFFSYCRQSSFVLNRVCPAKGIPVEEYLKFFTIDENQLSVRADIAVDSYMASSILEFLRTQFVLQGKSFSFETVMSHAGKIEDFRWARSMGYELFFFFITTLDPSINVARVAARVLKGGHAVKEENIIDRYYKAMDNLWEVIQLADESYLYDNSAEEAQQVAHYRHGALVSKFEPTPYWFDKYIIEKEFNAFQQQYIKQAPLLKAVLPALVESQDPDRITGYLDLLIEYLNYDIEFTHTSAIVHTLHTIDAKRALPYYKQFSLMLPEPLASGVFIPRSEGYKLAHGEFGNGSFNDIVRGLGIPRIQVHSYHGTLNEPFIEYGERDILCVGLETFTGNVLFVVTKPEVTQLLETEVEGFLRGYDLEFEFSSHWTAEILQEGIEEKSLTYEFLARVLSIEDDEPTGYGRYSIPRFGLDLEFSGGYLTAFEPMNQLGTWARHIYEINPSIIEGYELEAKKYWKEDRKKIIYEINQQADAWANLPMAHNNPYINDHITKEGNINYVMLLVTHHEAPITLSEFEQINYGRYTPVFSLNQKTKIYKLGKYIYQFSKEGELHHFKRKN